MIFRLVYVRPDSKYDTSELTQLCASFFALGSVLHRTEISSRSICVALLYNCISVIISTNLCFRNLPTMLSTLHKSLSYLRLFILLIDSSVEIPLDAKLKI